MADRLGEGVLWGIAIGMLLYAVFSPLIGYGWGFIPYVVALVAVYFVIDLVADNPFSRFSFENLQKGESAETRVGQLIEHAITRESCAVAHSVTKIAEIGDIDHIVVMPSAIWVIETKYKRVPRSRFPTVLGRIAANTRAVRQWAPAGTTVRGCLVLAYEDSIGKRNYSHANETIRVFTPELLGEEIRRESQSKRMVDERVAKDVWQLGQID